MSELADEVKTTTDVTYAERWWQRKRKATGPLTEEEARRRHESGELYVAVLGDPERPDAAVEVRLEAGFVGVRLLDDQGREYLTYLFGRDPAASDDLFLEQATWREFDGDEVVRGDTYHFKKDGTAVVERVDYATKEAETAELRPDVSSNWEPVPEFGQYESIARRDRG